MTRQGLHPVLLRRSDTARSDYMYKGKGRVVFSRNQLDSGQLKVING